VKPSPLDLRLHHWGFVVGDIYASASGFVTSLGAVWDGVVYEDPQQSVKVTFLTAGDSSSSMELVEPSSEDSPVSLFLQERGGGLHHVCYEIEDIEAALADLRERGALITKPPLPAVAFAGRRIAWVVTRQKLLVELLEKTARNG
jgi:methylmalonyl-CoA/ethylmalonyl-CoA epimerase